MRKIINSIGKGLTHTIPPETKALGNFIQKITDTTDQNIISPIDQARQQALEDQKRLWEREDAIRKETQAREDSAWQRSVEDARKAGINPNLINLTPAASGGGITAGTPIDYTMQEAEHSRMTQKEIAAYERATKLMIQQLEQEFEMSENQKDRIQKTVLGALTAGAIALK